MVRKRYLEFYGSRRIRAFAAFTDKFTLRLSRLTPRLRRSRWRYWFFVGAVSLSLGLGLVSNSDATARIFFGFSLLSILFFLAAPMFPLVVAGALLAMLGIFLAVAYPAVWVIQLRQHRLDSKRPGWNTEVDVTLASDGAILEPGTVTPWEKVARIDICPDGVLLKLDSNRISWHPFDALVTGSPREVTNLLLRVAPEKVMTSSQGTVRE
jgi:hypothetical protein